jgi:hypothetical protein
MPTKVEKLSVRFGRIDGGLDVIYTAPSKPDNWLLFNAFATKRYRAASAVWDASFLEELEKRGYDLRTIRFSIKKKAHKCS